MQPAQEDHWLAAVENADVAQLNKLVLTVSTPKVDARAPQLCTHWKEPAEGRGRTALMQAARTGDNTLFLALLKRGANINEQDQFGKTAAMYAIEYGTRAAITCLLEDSVLGSVDVNLRDMWGASLLMYAASRGDKDAADALLQRKDTILAAAHSKISATEDGDEDGYFDVYTIAARHGESEIVRSVLEKRKAEVFRTHKFAWSAMRSLLKVQSLSMHSQGGGGVAVRPKPSSALVHAAMRGHWLPQLVETHIDEISLYDDHGKTPLMHALLGGHDDFAQKLLALKADVHTSFDGKPLLLLALEAGTLKQSTIDSLIASGAPTGLPPLNEPGLSLAEVRALVTDDASHCIGFLCKSAREFKDEKLFYPARMCLASAFGEQPAAALVASVCVAQEMVDFAERVLLSDAGVSKFLMDEADEVANSVEALLDTIVDEGEWERILRSSAGTHFLRLVAKAAQLKKLTSAPKIAVHLQKCWWGSLMFAVREGAGIYQWGGELLLSRARRMEIAAVVVVAVVGNVLLLPLVALLPPVGAAIKGRLERMGEQGIDPRVAFRIETETGVKIRKDGAMSVGYVAPLAAWGKSLYLIDEPWFKFYTTVMCNALLLAGLMVITPCFSYLKDGTCFAVAQSSPLDTVLFTEYLTERDSGDGGIVVEGRMLKGRASHGHGAGHSAAVNDSSVVSTVTDVPEWGVNAGAAFSLIVLCLLAQLVSAVRCGPSFAATTTYASAASSFLALLFIVSDRSSIVQLQPAVDSIHPGLISSAVFLSTMDLSRAFLCQSSLFGPYVLMLSMMVVDVFVWMSLMFSITLCFASALYVYASVSGELDEMKVACSFYGDGRFLSYLYMLNEILIGGASPLECYKEQGDPVLVVLTLLYLLVSVVMMLNMIIAMMAKTFDRVFEYQAINYNYLFANIVLSVNLDQGDVPAPVSVLRAPWVGAIAVWRLATSTIHGLVGSLADRHQRLDKAERVELNISHVTSQERLGLLRKLDEVSERHKLVPSQLEKIIDSLAIMQDGKEVELPTTPVRVYRGFLEEASRLVFHYGDKFADLPKRPQLLTILKEGKVENPLQELPIASGHDEKDDAENSVLKTRALTAFPFVQTMDGVVAKRVLSTQPSEDALAAITNVGRLERERP